MLGIALKLMQVPRGSSELCLFQCAVGLAADGRAARFCSSGMLLKELFDVVLGHWAVWYHRTALLSTSSSRAKIVCVSKYS